MRPPDLPAAEPTSFAAHLRRSEGQARRRHVDPAAIGQPAGAPAAGRLGRLLDALIVGGFLAFLALAPLPLGGNSPFAWTSISLAVALLLLLWAVKALVQPDPQVMRLDEIALPAALFLIVVLWVLVQIAPWTPRSWHHPVWLLTREALGDDELPGAITINRHDSLTALMRLLAYAGAFWLALQIAGRRGGARRIVTTLAVVALLYAVYGLIAHTVVPDTLLWWPEWYVHGRLSSTFVNPNHYATYAGLGLLCVVALAIVRVYGDLLDPAAEPPSHRRLLRLAVRNAWLIVALLSIVVALLLTLSRAGNAATAIGLAVLIGCLARTRLIRPHQAQAAAGCLLVAGAMLFFLFGDDLAARIERASLGQDRFSVFGQIVRAVLDAPLAGTGYGTFGEAFRAYKGSISDLWWDHAHNTYLELAMELGVPATLLLVAAVLVLIVWCARALHGRRRSALYPCLALAASALVGAHALLDFSLEVPAVAVTYAALLGAGCARARPRRVAHPDGRRGSARFRDPAIAAAVAVAIVALAVPRLGFYTSAFAATLVHHQLDNRSIPGLGRIDETEAAGRAGPAWMDDAQLHHASGLAALVRAQQAALDDAARRSLLERAEISLRTSLKAAPADPFAWALLAFTRLQLDPGVPVIEDALRLSVLLGPNTPAVIPLRAAAAAFAWPDLGAETRALYRGQFEAAMEKRPQPFVRALRPLEEVEMIRQSLRGRPDLLERFERMRRVIGHEQAALTGRGGPGAAGVGG